MWRVSILLFLKFALLVAEESPDRGIVDVLLNATGLWYSDNINEDVNLNVPELVRKYKYPLEVHDIQTPDGYILGVHRIPHGSNNRKSHLQKPVIFLMHGLLCSSADWVVMGPGSGLAYILAEEGYDVWMGNARGNYYSRRHISLNPDDAYNTKFWEFSWDEIGNIDLPAMIDYILKNTGKSKLHYIGHSQGTTTFFVMGSLKPEYNDKIITMHALAPVAYMSHNRNRLLHYIAPFSTNLNLLAVAMGVGEFMPSSQIMKWAGQSLCRDEVVFQPICSNILFLIAGFNEEEHNATMLPVILAHTPAGASVRQFAHYGQGVAEKKFRRYDFGRVTNRKVYGFPVPPDYQLERVTAPVYLHYSERDPLAHVLDVDRLYRELGRPMKRTKIRMTKFSHLDFLWGIDVKKLVYDKVINIIKAWDYYGDLIE